MSRVLRDLRHGHPVQPDGRPIDEADAPAVEDRSSPDVNRTCCPLLKKRSLLGEEQREAREVSPAGRRPPPARSRCLAVRSRPKPRPRPYFTSRRPRARCAGTARKARPADTLEATAARMEHVQRRGRLTCSTTTSCARETLKAAPEPQSGRIAGRSRLLPSARSNATR